MNLSPEVIEVLTRAETDGVELRLVGQLDRKLYVATDKALQAAGGKWNRKAAAHIFPIDAAEAVRGMIASGAVKTVQEAGFFRTPPEVVARMLDLADLRPEHVALEPSAGDGAIVRPLAALVAAVDAIELDSDRAQALGLEPDARTVRCADFLTVGPEPVYDRVVMNPPFADRADVKHVRHALGFLKPGGRLVAVMSAGVTFRTDHLTADLRARIEDDVDGAMDPLPEGSFKSSGTGVNTVLVALTEFHVADPAGQLALFG